MTDQPQPESEVSVQEVLEAIHRQPEVVYNARRAGLSPSHWDDAVTQTLGDRGWANLTDSLWQYTNAWDYEVYPAGRHGELLDGPGGIIALSVIGPYYESDVYLRYDDDTGRSQVRALRCDEDDQGVRQRLAAVEAMFRARGYRRVGPDVWRTPVIGIDLELARPAVVTIWHCLFHDGDHPPP